MIDKSYYERPKGVPERTSAGGIVCRIDKDSGDIYFVAVGEAGKSHYILPKGGVDAGETLAEAAAREIGEEGGIHQLELIRELGSLARMSFDKRCWITTHFFLFKTDQIEFRPTDTTKPYRPEWWNIDDIGPMLWPEQQTLIEQNRATIKAAFTT